VKFRRQFPVGRYILDFYAPEHKLGIEADGGQHYEEEGRKRDALRAEEISKEGIRILRFSDRDILRNIEGVCDVILQEIEKSPSPQSSPQRGEEASKNGKNKFDE
jgi:adenine-specific DNA-methyltransferase